MNKYEIVSITGFGTIKLHDGMLAHVVENPVLSFFLSMIKSVDHALLFAARKPSTV